MYDDFPIYDCHKRVRAIKISQVDVLPEPRNSQLIPEDPQYPTIDVAPEWITRHAPEAGGYFVVYGDGYTSYSPAEAFESGYSLSDGEDDPHAKIAELTEVIATLHEANEALVGELEKRPPAPVEGQTAAAQITAMIATALADGTVTSEEKGAILSLLSQSDKDLDHTVADGAVEAEDFNAETPKQLEAKGAEFTQSPVDPADLEAAPVAPVVAEKPKAAAKPAPKKSTDKA